MDFPTAWAIARDAPMDAHEQACSYRQHSGGFLCDCRVLTQHPQYLADYPPDPQEIPSPAPADQR